MEETEIKNNAGFSRTAVGDLKGIADDVSAEKGLT